MKHNNWLDTDVLEDYLDGKLDAKAMHFVEKLALEDPFVAQAIEGLQQAPRRKHNLSLLQKQLKTRVEILPAVRKNWRIGTHRLSIAATAAILFISASLIFWMQENNKRKAEMARGKKVEVKLTPITPQLTPPKVDIDKAIVRSEADLVAVNKAPVNPSAKKINKSDFPTIASLNNKNVLAAAAANSGAELDVKNSPIPTRMSRMASVNASPSAIIRGQIVEANGLPVIGAVVKDASGKIVARSDANGSFGINSDSLSVKSSLSVNAIGFKGKEFIAKLDQPVKISLDQDDSKLAEVVVTGYGTSQAKVAMSKSDIPIVSASPVGGLAAFEEYLAKNNKLLSTSIQKSVVIEFNLENDGTPFRFKIIESQGQEIDEYAKQLLKNGPKWRSNQAKAPFRYSVKF